MIKIKYILFLLLFNSISLLADSNMEWKINYSAPTWNLEINNDKVKIIEYIEEYSNPVSSIPSRTGTKEKAGTLESKYIDSIKSKLGSGEFFSLEDFYGAPQKERHYPYTISIEYDSKKKSITYRSNPTYPKPSKIFSELEKIFHDIKKNNSFDKSTENQIKK